jgi:hypothetical protein
VRLETRWNLGVDHDLEIEKAHSLLRATIAERSTNLHLHLGILRRQSRQPRQPNLDHLALGCGAFKNEL